MCKQYKRWEFERYFCRQDKSKRTVYESSFSGKDGSRGGMFRKSFSQKLTSFAGDVVLKVGLLAIQRWHEFLFVVSVTSPEIKKYFKSRRTDKGYFKVTVRPDLICMRLVPLDRPRKTSTAMGFWFFNFSIEYFGSLFVLNPFFLLAGALLFDEKIFQSAALFWFGLRDVGILQIFYSRAVVHRTLLDSPAFLEHSSAEKNRSLCPYKPWSEVEVIKLNSAKIYRFLQLLSHSRGFFARV